MSNAFFFFGSQSLPTPTTNSNVYFQPCSSSYTRSFNREAEKNTSKMSLHRFQQLFPFRSSIVKNENVTEKGMTKKSWKAVFHKHTEHMRARENVPRSTFLFLLLHGEPEVACRDVRVAEWGCFALLFFFMLSKQRFMLELATVCVCMPCSMLLLLSLINSF